MTLTLMPRRTWAMRAVAGTLVALQALAGLPAMAASQAAEPEKRAKQKPFVPPPPPKVKVNRQAPKVEPPARAPRFSAQPADLEFLRVRVLEEGLVPLAGRPEPAENRALADALLAYAKRSDPDDVGSLTGFLAAHPESRWRGSLLLDLGLVYRWSGRFSHAMDAWHDAWKLAQPETTPYGRAVADRAVGELAAMHSRLGHYDELEAIFRELEGRDVRGPGAERIDAARQGLWLMRNEPEKAFRCGPFALDRIRVLRGAGVGDPRIVGSRSTSQGMSLGQVQSLAQELGMGLQMARREAGAELLLPAVVHWKLGHFAALVSKQGGRFLVQDPTFVEDFWVSQATLEAEASGYFLVPEGPLPPGWQAASPEQAQEVWGKGHIGGIEPNATTCFDPKPKNTCTSGCNNMADYDFHLPLVSLNIVDTPLSYSPPRGPGVNLTLTYNQKEANQPALFTYSNFGARWSFDWISYVRDDPANPARNLELYSRGGGTLVYSSVDASGETQPELKTQTTLKRTSANLFDPTLPPDAVAYVRNLTDGGQEVFYQSDGAVAYPRKLFLKEIADAQANRLKLTYDASFRLVAFTDAIGQVTTLDYELAYPDDLKITRVTDPFGRAARFDYTPPPDRRLMRITDLIGLTSEFSYGANDFITSLTTPYGTTLFSSGGVTGQNAWVEAIDPLGGRERVEFALHRPAGMPMDPPDSVPSDVTLCASCFTEFDSGTNTFYWDKRGMALAPRDYTAAYHARWVAVANPSTGIAVKWSEKAPLENHVYYFYAGQPDIFHAGSSNRPSRISRVLGLDANGNKLEQAYRYEYNSKGNKTRETDPLGRTTVYVYDANDTDLKEIRQLNGQNTELLQSLAYNAQHLPLTTKDAAGQTTTYTYNSQGQVLTVITPQRAGITENRTTTHSYDPNGYLQSVTGPATGATTSYTYDGYGRIRTVTDSDSYTLTYDYDALDRSTKVTYTDGTYDQTVYNRLDAEQRRDRLGRWSRTFYDALRRPTAMRDAAGRTVTQQWCNCGSLDKLTDANNNATTWDRDRQGRVTKETRANASFKEFTYETTTSRLKKIKDAKNQEIQYSYFLDDKLQQISYVNAHIPTPNLSYTYDAAYGRLATMTNGTGTTTYAYNPVTTPAVLGASQLSSVDGPLSNDTIKYGYDELGRDTTRTLNGITTTWSYDALGRLTTLGDPIGNFTYGYVGSTGRVNSVNYPNGQTTSYAYLPVNQDLRLQEIHHKTPAAVTLNKFNYTYDVVGNIQTWAQQTDTNPAQTYTYEYDRADQLTDATLPAATPKRYRYAYDPAANRTVEQIDDAATLATYDNMNRLISQVPGGALVFQGTLSEPSTVTVAGKPATVTPEGQFTGTAPVAAGTTTVEVKATDPAGNVRTNLYQVTVTGPSKSFTYDANGNLTSDATRTFEWDAENRLVAVKQGATTFASFTYDGSGRRTTKTAGGTTTAYVYDRAQFLEERPSVGSPMRYVYGPRIDQPLAQIVGGTTTYNVGDHLGSIARTTDSSGNPTLTREYDPWGSPIQGSATSGYAFSGREWDNETGLYYYRARYYDPKLARFVSEDPIGFGGGDNFYAYVLNSPANYRDPYGLQVQVCCAPAQILGGAVNHCWLKTPNVQAGMGNAGQVACKDQPMPGDDIRYPAPTQIVDHSACEATRNPVCTPASGVNQQCVERIIRLGPNGLGRPTGLWSPINQCQSLVKAILTICRSKSTFSSNWFTLGGRMTPKGGTP